MPAPAKPAEAPTQASPWLCATPIIWPRPIRISGSTGRRRSVHRHITRTSAWVAPWGVSITGANAIRSWTRYKCRWSAGIAARSAAVGAKRMPPPANENSGFSTSDAGSAGRVSIMSSRHVGGTAGWRSHGIADLLSRKYHAGCPIHSTSRSSR